MHKEKPLSPWVYIIIGGIIAGFSWFIRIATQTAHPEAMKLFTFIGGLFFFIGLLKLGWKKFKESRAGKKEEAFATKLSGLPENLQQNRWVQEQNERMKINPTYKNQNSNNKTPAIILCPRCESKNYSTSNYCHICGQRLK